MSPKDRTDLMIAYVQLAAYYQTRLDDATVSLYAQDLDDLPLDACLAAMTSLRRQKGRRHVPLPADIRDQAAPGLGSPTAQANEVASRVARAISTYGYTDPDGARRAVGELGWDVVTRMGTWQGICQSLTTAGLGTFYAQVRDLARSRIETGDVPRAAPQPARLDEHRARRIPSRALSSAADVVDSLRPLHARGA